MIKLTKEQALLYKKRWENVNRVQVLEMRANPISLKFQQLCFLMDTFRVLKTDSVRVKEENKIRRRWMILKKRLGSRGGEKRARHF